MRTRFGRAIGSRVAMLVLALPVLALVLDGAKRW
jgi:hypothetical protein